jgi:UDP-N-acetylmuramoylalanine--D-glutamate ligase
MSVENLLLVGKHNVQNALATVCVAKLLGVETQVISRALGDFKGIKHRIERVGIIDGVEYVDDSKATNVDATLKGVAAMKSEIVLLLGGKDKGYDYDKLFLALRNSNVVKSILYGENRFKLLESAIRTENKSVALCDNFTVAVNLARLTATAGQTVLLSPASASFDEFSGYEERGDKFVEIIENFQKEMQELQGVESEIPTTERVGESTEKGIGEQTYDDGEVE